MKNLYDFINGLSCPACVIDVSGRPSLLNSAMRETTAQPKSRSTDVPCFSYSAENGELCGGCSQYQITKGQCAIPRILPSGRLVMAAGLESMDGATVALYANRSSPNHVEIYEAIGDFLSLSKAPERRAPRRAGEPATRIWGARTRLIDLLQSAFEGIVSGKAVFELNAEGEAYMDFASLTAARLVIRRMALELVNFKQGGSVRVGSFAKSEKGLSSHVISMQTFVGRQAVKSLSSDISAMDMRLSGYCRRLGRMMELNITPPHTLLGGENADLRFELFGSFEQSSAPDNEGDSGNMLAGLSSRERQLVEMVAAGFTNEDISQKLGITVSTVKQHIKNIYRRTGLRSRLELALRVGV